MSLAVAMASLGGPDVLELISPITLNIAGRGPVLSSAGVFR